MPSMLQDSSDLSQHRSARPCMGSAEGLACPAATPTLRQRGGRFGGESVFVHCTCGLCVRPGHEHAMGKSACVGKEEHACLLRG